MIQKSHSIKFRLADVSYIAIDDFEMPTDGTLIDLKKPLTKVVLKNTQPVYLDSDMVGYVKDEYLLFEI
jgi:hypothetical protein